MTVLQRVPVLVRKSPEAAGGQGQLRRAKGWGGERERIAAPGRDKSV